MTPILISFLIFGLLSSAGIFIVLKSFSKKTSVGAGVDVQAEELKITEIDQDLNQALAHLEQMTPLSQAVEKEKQIAGIRAELEVETKKLASLDSQLSKLQASVETAEASHNELKKGKEDAESIADDIKARKDQLVDELKRLDGELQQSQTQLDVLADEVSLNKEQKAALAAISNALENASKQVSSLAEIYTVAATRFTTLENQYRELEKEFTKLVEKELSGKFE